MKIRRMFHDGALAPAVAFALMIVIGCSAALSEERRSIEAGPGEKTSAVSTSSSCAAGLRTFVTELDDLLAVYPQAYESFFALLNRSFPLKGCALAEVISICEQSRFFAGVSDNAGDLVIFFDNGKFFPGRGYRVSFGLDKRTGDTSHPSVQPNRTSS